MEKALRQTNEEETSAGRVEPALYLVLEGERPLAGGMRVPLRGLREITIGRGEQRSWTQEGTSATLTIADPRMSGKHLRLVVQPGHIDLTDLGSTDGTLVDYRRVTATKIEQPAIVTIGSTCLYIDPMEAVPDSATLRVDAESLKKRPAAFATLVPDVERTIPRLLRVASSKLSVLLLGESGVGKEVVARAMHAISKRRGPFVAIHCGALTPTLLDEGLIRASSGGTLFLDEIGELPAPAQAVLLRVLQEQAVLPAGETRPVEVDLRVISATSKPIDEEASFRVDLYGRIAAHVHRIPPLRDRRPDIGLIVAALLQRVAPDRAERLRLTPELVTALVSHPWPRNVRELEQTLSVATVTQPGDVLRLEDAGDTVRPPRLDQEPR